MKTSFVYCWTDHDTNKLYIGYHTGDKDDGYICSSKYMKAEYAKRPGSFTRQILASGELHDMIAYETLLLKICDAAKSPDFYNRHNNNGKYVSKGHTLESRKKMSLSKTGMKRSDESRLKQSKSTSGANNHFYGKKHSVETRQLLSKMKKGLYAGGNSPTAVAVKYNNHIYPTMKEFAESQNISVYKVREMIKLNVVEKV